VDSRLSVWCLFSNPEFDDIEERRAITDANGPGWRPAGPLALFHLDQ
jgi:hypothetical protein